MVDFCLRMSSSIIYSFIHCSNSSHSFEPVILEDHYHIRFFKTHKTVVPVSSSSAH
jgi:hypothetical protein